VIDDNRLQNAQAVKLDGVDFNVSFVALEREA